MGNFYLTVANLLEIYRDEVTVKKAGAREETLRINRFIERPFAKLRLNAISTRDIQKYVDQRLEEPSKKYAGHIAPATIIKELFTLSVAFSYAVKRGRVIRLPKEATKTDSKRDVALSTEALKILDLVRERKDKPRIFGGINDRVRDTLWRRIRDRADLGPVVDSEGRVIKEGLIKMRPFG